VYSYHSTIAPMVPDCSERRRSFSGVMDAALVVDAALKADLR
jgi:hypothetical protein